MERINLFERTTIARVPADAGGFTKLFEESKSIVEQAVVKYDPYATVLMLSGGDDSITALQVALLLGVKIDFIIHGVTGTGLPEVREYVHTVAAAVNITLLEADAGNAFEDYVRRKGFFGRGKDAHQYSYHILKVNPFEATISKHIRKGVPGRKILLLNGVRVEESDNRADNYGDNPYTVRNNNIWVNIIHWWTKKECLELLDQNGTQRNPVSIALGRSGECNCGTMQSQADIIQAAEFNPLWGDWMMALRKEVAGKFGWDICQQPNKKMIAEVKAQAATVAAFMPMCVGCKSKQKKLFDDSTPQMNGANATEAKK